MRVHCNTPLIDIESEETWRTRLGVYDLAEFTQVPYHACAALYQLAINMVDHDVTLAGRVRRHISDNNKACGVLVSGEEAASARASKLALP